MPRLRRVSTTLFEHSLHLQLLISIKRCTRDVYKNMRCHQHFGVNGMRARRSYRERSSRTIRRLHHLVLFAPSLPPSFPPKSARFPTLAHAPPFVLTTDVEIPDPIKFISLATATESKMKVIEPINTRDRNPTNPNRTKRACSSAKRLSLTAKHPEGSSWDDGV